jgi:hypothetical protein
MGNPTIGSRCLLDAFSASGLVQCIGKKQQTTVGCYERRESESTEEVAFRRLYR